MIKLLNATLTNIEVETEITSEGCETCDFGQEYTTYIDLEYYNFPNQHISFKDKISLGAIIKVLLDSEKFQKMSPPQFAEYLYKNLSKQVDK